MNTGRIRSFAQEARRMLIAGVRQRMNFWGFDGTGTITDEPEIISGGIIHRGNIYDDSSTGAKWLNLKSAVERKGYENILEEAAYTWFNRIMALKILSECGYEEPFLDFVSENVHLPHIIQRARRGETPYLNDEEIARIKSFLNDHDRLAETFAILITGFCHNHPLISRVFGRIDDFTELLLPENILKENGFIYYLNTTDAISAEDYQKVELIGWLYQFYISEKKDRVFEGFKKNRKAGPNEIPAATQIFTPNWIVKYMVENSVGQTWLDHKPDSPLSQSMKYLVENPYKQRTGIINDVTELKLLDPACGSGHILVEGFDLFYEMYMEEYYTPKEAVTSILKCNLFGLDIDLRAAQLARFAVLLKAAIKYPDVLKSDILPKIYSMPDPVSIPEHDVRSFLGKEQSAHLKEMNLVLSLMQGAQLLGSVMVIEIPDDLKEYIEKQLSGKSSIPDKLIPFLDVVTVLNRKYQAVVTNPPYMGSGNMESELKEYVCQNYPFSKSDLFAVFMEVSLNLTLKNGRMGMINQQSWMFLSSYEKFRLKIIKNYCIESMLHLGPRTFDEISGEVVQSTSFTIYNSLPQNSNKGSYHNLTSFRSCSDKETGFLKRSNCYCEISQNSFLNITGCPFAYWVNENISKLFISHSKLKDIAEPKQGMATTNNDIFLKYWWEVEFNKIGFNYRNRIEAIEKKGKWIPYSKGGTFRKWYGNNLYVVNFENDGETVCQYIDNTPGVNVKSNGRVINRNYYYREALTWSLTSSNNFGVRYRPSGFIFDVNGMSVFPETKTLFFSLLSFFNSVVCTELLRILNPTLAFQKGDIEKLPIILVKSDRIEEITDKLIAISKCDWDSSELSWDFKRNDIWFYGRNLKDSFDKWCTHVRDLFLQTHSFEEEINAHYINLYGLKDQLASTVEFKNVTILQEELNFNKLTNNHAEPSLPIQRETIIEKVVSYSIGCLMGRFRLDCAGIQSKDKIPKSYCFSSHINSGNRGVIFEIDDDGLLPLMANRGLFSDDAFHRLKQLMVIVWGEETLTENLNFIQECLGITVEDYLVKFFWEDHCRRYNKRPIYWLFSSKNGAFQVLAYMHRMNKFSAQKVREKYLFRHIRYLQDEIATLKRKDLNKPEARRLDQMIKDLHECEEYNIILKNVADRQIEFDLDDGVILNYAKFGEVLAPIK